MCLRVSNIGLRHCGAVVQSQHGCDTLMGFFLLSCGGSCAAGEACVVLLWFHDKSPNQERKKKRKRKRKKKTPTHASFNGTDLVNVKPRLLISVFILNGDVIRSPVYLERSVGALSSSSSSSSSSPSLVLPALLCPQTQ